MIADRRLRLTALVTEGERRIVHRGAMMLARKLTASAKAEWAVIYACMAASGEDAAGDGVLVTSLLPEVARFAEDWRECEARLWAMYRGFCGVAGRPVYVCTVLRHVSAEVLGRAEILVRIRRLNLLAVALSHELGVLVVDIDRDLADIGARTLRTDYRLGGPGAVQAAGKSLAMTMLLAGLDEAVPFDVLEAARAMLKTVPVAPAASAHRRRGLIGGYGRRVQAGRVSQIAMS